ncbi:linker for activation of T-cells family member 2 isoform X2 [Anolis carolinensis]|uniref:Linker for activation of T cells family member 2 n=1 Tax=Anolis carolinensis TaxID=28377 RepID=A0A803TYG7_ANOCA
MSQVELIWGAFSLMLLGALVSMCMKCQRAEKNKRKTSLDGQRNPCAAADYTTPDVRERLSVHAQKHSCSLRPKDQSGFEVEHSCSRMQMEQHPAYVEPLPATHYYNCRKFLSTSSDDDAHSYQNVTGPIASKASVLVNADVYENSTVVQLWKHAQAAESYSSDDEPEYMNAAQKPRFPA